MRLPFSRPAQRWITLATTTASSRTARYGPSTQSTPSIRPSTRSPSRLLYGEIDALAWGGTATRGDTDRQAQRFLMRLRKNILASQGAHGLHVAEPAVSVGGAPACGHYGFPSLDWVVRYCAKCGMRQDN